jgi:xylitol oxidase
MNKREFLKTGGIMVAGSVVSRALGEDAASAPRTNWAGNLTYSTNNLHSPSNLEEVRQVVTSCTRLRALGSRHSFNAIADSTANQLSTKLLNETTLDEKARTVTVGAGITYGQLSPWLDARGYALHNLASLPHISVAGAIATATHGSGLKNGNLATPVRALEIVAADGRVVRLSRDKDGDEFLGAVVGLGSLGVVTRVTLDVQPTYQVAQSVYQNLSFDELGKHFNDIYGSGYSVSVFTTWQNHRGEQLWIKRRVAPGDANKWEPTFFGATLAKEKLHPVAGHDAEPCTEQQGIPGPWYERLPHFRMNFTPSSGKELQTEYLVPLEHASDAIFAVERLRDRITPLLFITELRTIAADNLWMSSAYKRDSLAIHFTWKPEWPEVKAVLPAIEAQLEPFAPRPHWAKLFTMAPAKVQSRYERLAEFEAMVKHYDPSGKFRNNFIDTNLYSS